MGDFFFTILIGVCIFLGINFIIWLAANPWVWIIIAAVGVVIGYFVEEGGK